MKNLTLLMVLCVLFLGVFCTAQDIEQEQNFDDLVICTIESQKKGIDYKASLEKHSILLKVLKAAKLDEVLGYNGDFTVFAPSNIAFEQLTKVTVEQLLEPKNIKVLKAILSRHIIAGKLTASTILLAMCRGNGEANFTTIQGDKITATMNGLDIVLTDKVGNHASIITADSNYSNGVVHEIDSVFLPKTVL